LLKQYIHRAIQKFAAYDIGCLVTTDANGDISGVISERDYISKVALLGRKSKELMVKDISTKTANLMTATPSDSIDTCMTKMITKDIRHLPLLNEDGKVGDVGSYPKTGK
jgi:CBS domain-containing protein